MKNKILALLGFAAKAGRLSFGYEATISAIRSRKSCLVLTADDLSQKSAKEVAFFAERKNIETLTLNDIDISTLSVAVGRKCGIVSVNDSGFADTLKAMV